MNRWILHVFKELRLEHENGFEEIRSLPDDAYNLGVAITKARKLEKKNILLTCIMKVADGK